jgi:hypothetical protein
MSLRMTRRGVLGAGAALAAGTLLPRGVEAANPAPPTRLIIVFTADGTIYPSWAPQGTETSFTLSPILQPLAPYQSKLLILDGIDVTSAGNGPGDDHMKGMGHMLTGIELLPGTTMGGAGTPAGLAGGISIDQRIAQDIGMQTRFPSLEFGVHVINSDVWARMIYSGANQPLPPMEDPTQAFARVFSGSQLSAQQQAILLKRRQSTLDYAQATLSGLAPRISADDRIRIQQHHDSINAIEKQLLAQTAACASPSGVMSLDLNDINNYPAVGKMQMDILVAALACGQTRIASLQWSTSVSDIPMPWLSIGTGHHTLSHKDDSDTASQQQLVQINTWYAQQFAYLLQKLDSIQESNGTLLDNCMVMWINELAKGNIHSHNPLPVVIAGKCGGAIRTGRYVTYPQSQPHNNMLVSIANAFGTNITTFGNPAYCTGPLTNFA